MENNSNNNSIFFFFFFLKNLSASRRNAINLKLFQKEKMKTKQEAIDKECFDAKSR